MTAPTILRDTALCLPGPVVFAGWLGGSGAAASAGAGAVALVANLAVLSWLVPRMLDGGAMGFSMLKTGALLAVFAGLLVLFDPMWVGFGVGSMMLIFALAGVRTGLAAPVEA